MFKYYISTFAVASVIVSAASFAAELPASEAMQKLRSDHPKLRTFERNGQIHKLNAPELATGRTPIDAAENFISTWSQGLGVDPKEFIARGPFPDGHSVSRTYV